MTTEQILFWVILGGIGLITILVFIYGIERIRHDAKVQRIAYLEANNATLQAQLKDTLLELTQEIEARKETSELLMKAGNELNQLNRLVQKRGEDGRFINKN